MLRTGRALARRGQLERVPEFWAAADRLYPSLAFAGQCRLTGDQPRSAFAVRRSPPMHRTTLLASLASAALAVSLAACGGDSTGTTSGAPIARVDISAGDL